METAKKDPNFDPVRPEEPELDLYTIPGHSRWFLWDDIHETERKALKEFFDGSSISRTPRIYKEYRDFIINKYREEPSRRLTFTEVRKSLVGDVSLLHKVFSFLEKWGLINYGAPPSSAGGNGNLSSVDEEKHKVKIEEGAPNGIRVVATPNSIKPLSLPLEQQQKISGSKIESRVKLPPLASYSDVFSYQMKLQEFKCGNCFGKCDSGGYQYRKNDSIVCAKCFRDENYGEERSVDDFKVISDSNERKPNCGAVWTEAETLLLLESVLKHGDDWELVARNVQTKSKLECVSKLIEMPVGELILGSSFRNDNLSGTSTVMDGVNASSYRVEDSEMKNECSELSNGTKQNGNAFNDKPPSKRRCISPFTSSSNLLMNQVASISSMVGPHIAAVGAEAAITALCDESGCPRDIFDAEESYSSYRRLNADPESGHQEQSSEIDRSNYSGHIEAQERFPKKDYIPPSLEIRAAVATALGTAGVRAKLLADKEDTEITLLVATIIETQIEKLQHKIKYFEELELLMEKEHSEIEEIQDSLLEERIDVLQKAFHAGIPRCKDYPSVKLLD